PAPLLRRSEGVQHPAAGLRALQRRGAAGRGGAGRMSELELRPVGTAEPSGALDTPVLRVRGLRVAFATHHGEVVAANGIDLDVRPGETLGIVGESGSGKSATVSAVMGLLPQARVEATEIRLGGEDLRSA